MQKTKSFWQRFQQFRFQIAAYSFQGLIYFVWLRLRKKELYIGGHCNCCGNCCRKLSLLGADGWLRKEEDFRATLALHPEYERFVITGRDRQGFLLFSCSWCTLEGICRDYTNRLSLCENFPEKSMRFCGGSLPAGCGYYFSEVVPFQKILSRIEKEKAHAENSAR